MEYVELKLWKCKNSTTPGSPVCLSTAAIDDYLRVETFSMAFINTMFVSDNYDEPLKPFIDDQLFFDLDPRVIKKANFFV